MYGLLRHLAETTHYLHHVHRKFRPIVRNSIPSTKRKVDAKCTLCCYRRPAIFDKFLNNKRSMFSRPRHGVHWKRHIHRCSMTYSPTLYVLPTRSYAPPKSVCSFCRTLYYTHTGKIKLPLSQRWLMYIKVSRNFMQCQLVNNSSTTGVLFNLWDTSSMLLWNVILFTIHHGVTPLKIWMFMCTTQWEHQTLQCRYFMCVSNTNESTLSHW
jgi:hypothetical protein